MSRPHRHLITLAGLLLSLGCIPMTPGNATPAGTSPEPATGSDLEASRGPAAAARFRDAKGAPRLTSVDVDEDRAYIHHWQYLGHVLRWPYLGSESKANRFEIFNPNDQRVYYVWEFNREDTYSIGYSGINVIDGRPYFIDGENRDIDFIPGAGAVIRQKGRLYEGTRYVSTVKADNKIYIMGGFYSSDDISGYYSDSMYVYDPVQEKMVFEARGLSPERSDFGLTYLDGKIYVIGGNGASHLNVKWDWSYNPLKSLQTYDVATKQWEKKADLSVARVAPGATVLDGKIYVFGGYDGSQVLDTVEIYDPVQDTWTQGKPMSAPRVGLAAATLKDQIYLFGGEGAKGGTDDRMSRYGFESYDP